MIVPEDETTKRALAVEGALAMLVGKLAEKAILTGAEALPIVRMLTGSSGLSKSQHAPVIEALERLQSLEQKQV